MTSNRKAFVLLSGGLDSTTCLHKAIIDYAPTSFEPGEVQKRIYDWPQDAFPIDWVEAISVNYGQRHIREAEFAFSTCQKFGINHYTLYLKDILSGDNVMLTDSNVKIPDISYGEIKGVSPTYVPFRNGTMLSLITAHAQKWVNSRIAEYERQCLESDMNEYSAKRAAAESMKDSCGIYFGAHSEDAAGWAYPDCTPEFIGAMANAIYIGSYMCIRLHTPLQWLMKDEIVTLGDKLGVDFDKTWSCYAGGSIHCGTCPTCRSRKDAFKRAGILDPTYYAA